ncbi:unnamed protein product [Owenia fusiformis]|uniref:Uncharacterized protein n=1 Tax=Owenia fusiformis TaxID=6347 RepID=A0A8J1TCC9_OWEFU|nr:unnamed protein product [Owenia fusiformis]
MFGAVKPILLLFGVCLLQEKSHGQQLNAQEHRRINDFITRAMECHGYTGLLVSVVRGGEAVFTEGFGDAIKDDDNPSNNVKVTADTIFPIASVSKHMTSSIIGKVLQNTSYTWSTPFRKMMSELPTPEDIYFSDFWRTNKTSLTDLLAHRMGTSGQDVLLAMDQWTKPELMQRLRFLRPNAEFRNSYLYNNIMYAVASYVAERHAGKEWDELLRDEFFEPLGMRNTSTIRLGLDSNYSGWAQPHVNVLFDRNDTIGPLPMELIRGVANAAAGAGGVATTAKDMAKWMNFQLDFENDRYKSILDPILTHQIRRGIWVRTTGFSESRVPPMSNFSRGSLSYGLGIGNDFWRGHPMLTHGGSLVIYTSTYAILPYMNIGVFIASNQPALFLPEIRMFIMDLLLGVSDPYMDIDKFCKLPDSVVHVIPTVVEGQNEDFGLRYGIETMLKQVGINKLKRLRSKLANKDLRGLKSNENAYAIAKAIQAIPDADDRNQKRSDEDFRKYTGTYGNFAYGNCTVKLYPKNDTGIIDGLFDGDLMLTYGWLELTLKRIDPSNPDVFELSVLEEYIPTTDNVTFWRSTTNGSIDRMELSLDPADGPYPWVRDLKFSDAPPPLAHECPTPPPPPACPTRPSSASGAVANIAMTIIVLIVWNMT